MVWIGLVFATALILFSSFATSSQLTQMYGNMNDFYRNFYSGKEGPITDQLRQETNEWIKTNWKSLSPKIATGQANVQDKRTLALYSQIAQPDTLSENRTDKISSLQNDEQNAKGDYERKKAGLNISMLKSVKTSSFYFTLPLDNDVNFTMGLGFVIMGILILLGVSPIFTEEYSTNMDLLILSSKKGRRSVVTSKVLSTVVYCIFIALFVLLLNFLIQAASLGIHGLNAPIQLNRIFTDSPYAVTYGTYLLIQFCLSTLACVFFGLLVLFVSSISVNVLLPFFICGTLFASTAFINSLSSAVPTALTEFSNLSYTELMRVDKLFKSFKTYNLFGQPILYLNMIIGLYIIFTALAICSTYFIFIRREAK
jgi:ABC-type transport system involved in multi-copper enzyme maturation permease subunit